jgi:hypothetical protein
MHSSGDNMGKMAPMGKGSTLPPHQIGGGGKGGPAHPLPPTPTNNSHHNMSHTGQAYMGEDSSNDQSMDGRYGTHDENSSGSYANEGGIPHFNMSEMSGHDSNYDQFDMRGHQGNIKGQVCSQVLTSISIRSVSISIGSCT